MIINWHAIGRVASGDISQKVQCATCRSITRERHQVREEAENDNRPSGSFAVRDMQRWDYCRECALKPSRGGPSRNDLLIRSHSSDLCDSLPSLLFPLFLPTLRILSISISHFCYRGVRIRVFFSYLFYSSTVFAIIYSWTKLTHNFFFIFSLKFFVKI